MATELWEVVKWAARPDTDDANSHNTKDSPAQMAGGE